VKVLLIKIVKKTEKTCQKYRKKSEKLLTLIRSYGKLTKLSQKAEA